MGVVRDDQRDAGLVMYLYEPFGSFFLVFDSVVLKLQIKASLTEKLGKLQSFFFCSVILPVYYCRWDITRQTGRETYEAFVVLFQQRPVYAGLYIEAVHP